MKKLRENENLLEELESDVCSIQIRPKARSLKKNQFKFSVSNDKELFESHTPKKITKPPKKRKFLETKAKSEQKYSGGPLYQIFIAKYPELQALNGKFSSSFERKSAKSSLYFNSPTLRKSPMLKGNFPTEFEENKENEEIIQEKTTPRKHRKKFEEKTCINNINADKIYNKINFYTILIFVLYRHFFQ